jgi:predicted dehydrogenase
MNSGDRIGVGLIGCGLMAQTIHGRYLRELEDRFAITAVADLSEAQANYVGDMFNVPSRYADYNDLLADPAVEAVLILTGGDHTAMTVAAMEAGKHALVEKPLAFTTAAVERVIAAERASPAKVLMGYCMAFDPAFTKAREELADWDEIEFVGAQLLFPNVDLYFTHQHYRELGEIPEGARARSDVTDPDHPVAQLAAAELGGMPDPASLRNYFRLFQATVHDVYLLRLLLGHPPRVITSDHWHRGDHFAGTLEYPGGTLVQYSMVANRNLRNVVQDYALVGGSRRMWIRWPSNFLLSEPTELVVEDMVDGAHEARHIGVSYEESYQIQLRHFHDVCTARAEPLHTAADALRDTAVLVDMGRMAWQAQQEREG